MKSVIRNFAMALVTLVVAFSITMTAEASAKSDANKMLSAYKAGKYSEAIRYGKKLPKNQSKTCIKKLSKKAKAAYKKKVKSYPLGFSGDYLWGYYLVDLTGDKKAELMIQHGTCEADARTEIYTFKGGKLKKLAEVASGHTMYYDYPGHTGVIVFWCHMGYEGLSTMRIKGGKINTTAIGDREIKNGSFLDMNGALYSHIKYGSNYKPSLDLKDLK